MALLLPSQAAKPLRVIGAVATSDKATSKMTFQATTTVTEVTTTETNSSATNFVVTSTAGFASNDVVVLERASDGNWNTATVWGTSGGTNLILSTAGPNLFGMTAFAGDRIGKLGEAVTLYGCNCTVSYQSECLFIADQGRSVYVTWDGTSACSIDSLAYKYGE